MPEWALIAGPGFNSNVYSVILFQSFFENYVWPSPLASTSCQVLIKLCIPLLTSSDMGDELLPPPAIIKVALKYFKSIPIDLGLGTENPRSLDV